MSFEVADVSTEVDLSKLISFSMSFQPLQLLFQTILQRTKQVESENERQDDEIGQLRDALKDLQQRDAEREAQMQELLQQQEELLKQKKKEEEEEDKTQGTEEVLYKEDGAQPVDTRQLWDEINRMKNLMGEFHRPARRHTIEELYHARKRKGSIASSTETKRQKSLASLAQLGGLLEEVETSVGDSILDRAKEQLVVDESRPLVSSPEEGEPAGESMEPPSRGEERRQTQVGYISDEGMPPQGQEEGRRSDLSGGRGAGGDSAAPVFSAGGEDQPAPTRSDSPGPVERSGVLSAGGMEGASPFSSSVPHSREQMAISGRTSIYDRLRQDSKDIEHLNRVVAEMLNEMKSLHADVDFMRGASVGEEGAEKAAVVVDPNAAQERADLRRRVEALEDAVGRLQNRVDPSDGGATPMPDKAPASEVSRRTSLMDGIKGLKERLDALEQAQERTDNKMGGLFDAVSSSGGDTGVSPAQLGLLSSTVNTLEKQLADLQRLGLRNCDDDLEALKKAVEQLQRDTAALEKTCVLLDDRKEDKGGRPQSFVAPTSEKEDTAFVESVPTVKDSGDSAAVLDDLQRRLQELQRRLLHTEANVNDLDEQKADRVAFQRLSDELKQLRQLLELGAGRRGDDDAARSAAAMQDELVQALQQQIAEHVQNFNKVRDGTTTELDALRDYVEQIDHRKADAMLVANKAERDYVENALERLMREVEQVLNATNAGLIDTLDKSLNVLRDMLEGKATKHDMDNLRRLVSEDHIGGGAPDALAGFRGFRCLGCNRPVETMRPRVMGNRLQPFVNRLPQNHPGDPIAARIQQGPPAVSDGTHNVPESG